jgi:hypothetical protein
MKAKSRMLANPSFAALIDVDAFQEDPLSVDPRDFIETSLLQAESRLTALTAK